MDAWETNSEIRLGYRRVIRGVIDDWVHGPVDLLAAGDLRELRGKVREAWVDGERKSWKYVAWMAEVNLALGCEGDPLRQLRGKKVKPSIDLRGVSPEVRAWVMEQEGAKVRKDEDAAEAGAVGDGEKFMHDDGKFILEMDVDLGGAQ